MLINYVYLMRASLQKNKSLALVAAVMLIMIGARSAYAQTDSLATTAPAMVDELQQLDQRANKALGNFDNLQQHLQVGTELSWENFFDVTNIGLWITLSFLLILAILLLLVRKAVGARGARPRIAATAPREAVREVSQSSRSSSPLVMPRRIVKIKVRKIKTPKNNL